ncbi:hypothetical protein [Psychrobacillus phage Perkons]|nr:hypothetical protein [Psychrobacillus phage Perkons]
MATLEPLVSWYEAENKTSSEVLDKFDYKTVDADTPSLQKTIYIWNNRGGSEDHSKMEEVTFTTKDRAGGTGDSPVVEAVRDNWFNVRVDSLNEVAFTPVGKGGVGTTNVSGVKALGTNGTTTNPKASTASTWATGVEYNVGDYIKPTSANLFIYKVTVKGTTGGSEPAWSTTENNTVTDGGVSYIAIRIIKPAGTQEILGLANNALADGSNATLSGANFAKITVYAEVPPTAKAGKNLLVSRVN